jgi:hypothetical protein
MGEKRKNRLLHTEYSLFNGFFVLCLLRRRCLISLIGG